jgi:hypothetical protein
VGTKCVGKFHVSRHLLSTSNGPPEELTGSGGIQGQEVIPALGDGFLVWTEETGNRFPEELPLALALKDHHVFTGEQEREEHYKLQQHTTSGLHVPECRRCGGGGRR